MWHVWMKSFRKRNNLTQEAAAHILCIDVRTIRRWEAGGYPSSTHVQKFEHILMPSQDHRLARNIKPLLEITGDIMVAFDENHRVIGQSRAHKALMRQLWGGDGDLTGVDWFHSKYMPPNLRRGTIEEVGVGPKGFKNGILSIRVPFLHEVDGQVVNGGRIDATYLQLADGNVIVSVTHRDVSPEFVDGYLRPWVSKKARDVPDGITTLDS